MTTKTNISFKLPGVRITYSAPEKKEPEKIDEQKPVTYGYTIQI